MEKEGNSRYSISEKAERRASVRTQQPFPGKENSASTAQKTEEHQLVTEHELLKVCTAGQANVHVQSCRSQKQLQLCAVLFLDLASLDRECYLPKHLNPSFFLRHRTFVWIGGAIQFSSKCILTLHFVKRCYLCSYSYLMLGNL